MSFFRVVRPRASVLLAVAVTIVLALVPITSSAVGGAPDVPTGIAASGSIGGSATVTWIAATTAPSPASYLVQAFDSATGYAGSAAACGTCISAVINGLVGSRTYQFVVYATNAIGAAAAVSPATTMPAAAPTVPLDVRAEGRDKVLRVAWLPPANEGAPLAGYAISVITAGGLVVASASACATCTSARSSRCL